MSKNILPIDLPKPIISKNDAYSLYPRLHKVLILLAHI